MATSNCDTLLSDAYWMEDTIRIGTSTDGQVILCFSCGIVHRPVLLHLTLATDRPPVFVPPDT